MIGAVVVVAVVVVAGPPLGVKIHQWGNYLRSDLRSNLRVDYSRVDSMVWGRNVSPPQHYSQQLRYGHGGCMESDG